MKKKVSKKILAWLMSAAMLGSLGGMTVFAAPEGDPATLPESTHPYENNYDNTWEYEVEGASNGIYVTFAAETKVEAMYDYIYVYDGADTQIGKYTGDELAGVTVYVPDSSSVKIRLTSDKSSNDYGFKVTNIEACGDTIDLSRVGTVDAIAPVEVGGTIAPVVRVNGNALENGNDYTVTYDSSAAGDATATITGTGEYSGELQASFFVYNDSTLAASPIVKPSINTQLRLGGNTPQATSIQFEGADGAWASAITSVTLTPVDQDGTPTDTGSAVYPNAPKEITLTASDISASGNTVTFYRTAENPVVYVMQGHEPIEIRGRWSTVTYPQSQIYKVTVKATGYEDTVGTTTYYTGTAPAFSIIVDADGDSSTTDDQQVVKSWSSAEIAAMSTFANGSSQCGMTGFRTFSGMGVSLKDLLADANVTVSATDSFLLDTSDHYGNTFTYNQLFGSTRYFLSSIYDDDFADIYDELVDSDDEAGSTIALRRYLADECLANNTVVEPRINVSYAETMVSADNLESAVLPTAENTAYNSLVCYENQFRFFYGIEVVKEERTVTFDSQGGSEVAAQSVLSNYMTSTENTTIKSSYWANSLVIYRGAGEEPDSSNAASKISVPESPTREGYVFAGWYTDAACTDGNEFEFAANNGTVDQDTTLYAKWIAEEDAVSVTDFDAYTDHEGVAVSGTDLQTAYITLNFNQAVSITDEAALKAEMANSITLGGVLNNGTIGDLALSADGKTLTFTISGWFAPYSGWVKSTGVWNNLVTTDGDCADANFGFIIPNGLYTNTVEQVIADENTNASVTTQIVKPDNATRGMVHMMVLKNGQPIGSLSANHAMATGHLHMYLTMTAENFVNNSLSALRNALGDGYTVEADGDKFVITATDSEPGDVLEMHIVSYLNDGSKTINADTLNATIANAQAVDKTKYTAESYAAVSEALKLAQVVAADTTYYAQTDVNAANEKLANAVSGLSLIQTNPSGQPSGSADDQNTGATSDKGTGTSPKTSDEAVAVFWIAVAVVCAGSVFVFERRRRIYHAN